MDPEALALDAANPLAAFRSCFLRPEPDLVYVDGNSLGRLPLDAVARIRRAVEHEWGERLIRSWNEGWIDAPRRVGDRIGELIGAGPGQVVVADSTSVNLHRLAEAAMVALAPEGRCDLVTDDLNFPSDRYVLQGLAKRFGGQLVVVPTDGVHGDLEATVAAMGPRTAVVSLSLVAYRSGYRADDARINAAARAAGAMSLWDLSHAAGAVEVDLDRAGADLAVGCTYKYLCGGPGAPAYLYVSARLQERLVSPIQGWFGQHRPFDFDPEYRPAEGIDRFLVGTPPILSLLGMEPGVELVARAGMAAIRARSVALSEYFVSRAEAELVPLGFRVDSPRMVVRRGSHVLLGHPQARGLVEALVRESGIIPDFRAPDGLRVGIHPLDTTAVELARVVDELVRLTRETAWTRHRPQGRVT